MISEKLKEEIKELQKIDPNIPELSVLQSYFQIISTYHWTNYIHGDLNPENVLVWENERGILNCKLIDFGEVIPKFQEKFTPLFWDFSRLLGEMILNYVEDIHSDVFNSKDTQKGLNAVNQSLHSFWTVLESIWRDGRSSDISSMDYIVKIYLSTLFDFLNDAKSGFKENLRSAEVIQDYFYCQILFFFFYAKFKRENKFKRIFSIYLGQKL